MRQAATGGNNSPQHWLREPTGLQAEPNAALYTLGEIRRLVSEGGRDGFNESEDRRRAIAWCW